MQGQPNNPNPLDQQIPPPPMPEPVTPVDESPEAFDNDPAGELGRAIRFLAAKSEETFLLKDDLDRVLCVHRGRRGDWGWAYMAPYARYNNDVYPVLIEIHPHSRLGTLMVHVDGEQWNLYANGKGTEAEYLFFANHPWRGYPQPQFSARLNPADSQGMRTYSLAWQHSGATMFLRAGPGQWNWLTVSASERNVYTLHKFYIDISKLRSLIARTWPSATVFVQAPDQHCEAISDVQAKRIWANSGLAHMRYRPEAFDCDDYAFVYKAQACRDAYEAHARLGYAVGIVHGYNPRTGHAAILFVDFGGRLRLIEPQTGQVSDAKDWPYTPRMVCF